MPHPDSRPRRALRRYPPVADLAAHDFQSVPRVALHKGFTHADDGRAAPLDRTARFLQHHLVGFSEILEALGMPDDTICAAVVDEHFYRDLTRERAVLL